MTDQEIYSFLNICFENYYENFDVSISTVLDDFEQTLVEERHLADTTGEAYKALLNSLDSTLYFKTPLHKSDFNKIVLYKSPSDILSCAMQTFAIDSTTITSTNYAKVSAEIQQKMVASETVSIHYFFQLYYDQLSPEEIKSPYIKESILLLLYRWYYKSKYDREIPIKDFPPSSIEDTL